MLRKAVILISLSMVGTFAFVLFLDQGETKPLVIHHAPSIGDKTYSDSCTAQTLGTENAYTAIVLIPKTYLPMLERFKRSNMAKFIKILPAKLELRDGEVTAVMKEYKATDFGNRIGQKQKVYKTNNTDTETDPSENRRKILSAGLLYLMAGLAKKSR